MPALTSQRDEPGTQREYETIYILRPDANTDQIHDINSRIRKIIEGTAGKLIRVDNWGKRKLAYEIRKELKGIYLYWLYLGDSSLVAEIERNLRMLDLVIRYYTVKVEEGVNPDVRPTQMDDESFAATATIIPDEEDAYLGRASFDEVHDIHSDSYFGSGREDAIVADKSSDGTADRHEGADQEVEAAAADETSDAAAQPEDTEPVEIPAEVEAASTPPVEQAASTEEQAAPTEEQAAPTEEQAAPTEEQAAPTEEQAAPTEEQAADSATPAGDADEADAAAVEKKEEQS